MGELWGLDTYSVADKYWGELIGFKKPAVIAIGQAGENLVSTEYKADVRTVLCPARVGSKRSTNSEKN